MIGQDASQQFYLRRSVLSVPANRPRMVAKARELPADMIMFDLEDSIPVQEKETARRELIRILEQGEWGGRPLAFRINDMTTPFAYRDMIDVLEQAGKHLAVVVVPKVEEAAQVKAVDYLLTQIEQRQGYNHSFGVEACIETAQGLLKVEEIAFSSDRLQSLVFGIADYGASLGMPSQTVSGHGDLQGPDARFHYPLSRLVMTAKAAGLQAIDAPFGDFRDKAGLRQSAGYSAALGYDGKWAIHPAQLELINELFTPSAGQVEEARQIVACLAEKSRTGAGSLAVEGKMVDAASVRLARQTCKKWELIQSCLAQQGSS